MHSAHTSFLGLYTWLVIKCSLILLHKDRRHNKIAIFTWMIVITMYLIKLTLWTIDARNVISDLNILLVQNNDHSLAQRQLYAKESSTKLAVVEDVLYAFQVVLGDTIVLWRVYAFWHTGIEVWVMLIPGAAYLASLACAFLVTYCAAQSTDLEFGAFTNPRFCQNIQHISYWLQFVMACTATGLIGFKTWKYRRMVKTLIGKETVWRSPVSKAMVIMLDTGLIYGVFFLAEAVLGAVNIPKWVSGHPSRGFALQIYQYQTSAIVGIYPTIVVLLVHTHTQSFLIDSSGQQTISTLHFGTNRTGRIGSTPHHHHAHNHSRHLSHPQFINTTRGTTTTTTGWTSHSQDVSDTDVGSGGDVRSRRRSGKFKFLSPTDSESGYVIREDGFAVGVDGHGGGDVEDGLENTISLHELRPGKRVGLGVGEEEEEEDEEEERSVKKVPVEERVDRVDGDV
ncbi:hypothetical protein BDY19DRAFT_428691 [Irpex rosettiformis]|uniref:Uncharacterized protein n=1 Tax=Irpex rosettiformis TaxID=378272 RepID=A0ACB8UGS1_9APHY|nr:hypothetical protein BDY19DRAFT_428691 [Irpex rosettiformis]